MLHIEELQVALQAEADGPVIDDGALGRRDHVGIYADHYLGEVVALGGCAKLGVSRRIGNAGPFRISFVEGNDGDVIILEFCKQLRHEVALQADVGEDFVRLHSRGQRQDVHRFGVGGEKGG